MLLRKYCGGWAILAFSPLASAAMDVGVDDNPPLPATIQFEPAVNPANVRSATLRDSVSKLPYLRTSEQVRRGTQCTMTYSQDAITTSSGKILYGIPVHPSNLRSLLQHANQFGRTQDVNSFSPSFRYSANGLTLIINAIASTRGRPTFNWAMYADVAKILLSDTAATGNEPNGSWVGVVKNSSGAFVAEMGIIPISIVVPGAPKSTPFSKLQTGLAKRDTYAIFGTSYRLVVNRGTILVDGSVLINIARYVLDSILLQPAFEGYTAIVTNDQSRDLWGPNDRLRDLWGPNAFSLVTHGGAVINYNDMVEILRTIYAAVYTYSSRRTGSGPRHYLLVRNLEGQISGAAGALIATWSIGGVPQPELAAASVCPPVVVTHPDDSIALGCIRS